MSQIVIQCTDDLPDDLALIEDLTLTLDERRQQTSNESATEAWKDPEYKRPQTSSLHTVTREIMLNEVYLVSL